mmetsp:Transcript_10144/g.28921  ORF Transcript_10144/g.28921 Transcript_10144/m.28921 type:complete len:115 (-) Transcript_10144:18-362(-)
MPAESKVLKEFGGTYRRPQRRLRRSVPAHRDWSPPFRMLLNFRQQLGLSRCPQLPQELSALVRCWILGFPNADTLQQRQQQHYSSRGQQLLKPTLQMYSIHSQDGQQDQCKIVL